jgi:uncharacterized protein
MTFHDHVDVILGDQTLRLLSDKAALWLEQNMLLVADIHLGKATTFQNAGLAVPSGHGERDLECLVQLCKKINSQSMAILGDLFHAKIGLNDELVANLTKTFATLELPVLWITGNHDRGLHGLAEKLDVRLEKRLVMSGLELTHKPNGADIPCVCGHLHPRVQLWAQKQKLELPCFVKDVDTLILPAFSSFSAGTTMKSAAGRKRYACAGHQVLEL